MGVKTGFVRTLLMVMVAGMLSACSSVGAQVATPHRHIRPQTRATVQVRFYGYFTPYRYQRSYRPYARRPVARRPLERGVINRSRVAPRPNPQRSRSMDRRPRRRADISMNDIRERISAWAIRRTSRPTLIELPPLPIIDLPEFSDDFYIDLDYLTEPPLPEPSLPNVGESYDR